MLYPSIKGHLADMLGFSEHRVTPLTIKLCRLCESSHRETRNKIVWQHSSESTWRFEFF